MNKLRTLAQEMMDISPSNHERVRDISYLYNLQATADNLSVLFMGDKVVDIHGNIVLSSLLGSEVSSDSAKHCFRRMKTIGDFSVICSLFGIKLRWNKPSIRDIFNVDLSDKIKN